MFSCLGIWINGRQLSAKCHVEFTKHVARRNHQQAGLLQSFGIGMIKAYILSADSRGDRQIFCEILERTVIETFDFEDMYVLRKNFPQPLESKLIHVDRFRRQIHIAPHWNDIKSSSRKRTANDRVLLASEPNVDIGDSQLLLGHEEEKKEIDNFIVPVGHSDNEKVVAIPMREIL